MATPRVGVRPDPAPASRVERALPDAGRFDAVDALSREALPAWGGGVVHIEQDGRVLFEKAYGGYRHTDAVPIASGTKSLSALVLLSLVRDGTLALDAPVAARLPGWPADKKAVTLRMLLAHTSGLPAPAPCLDDRATTLEACAAQISRLPLRQAPGAGFVYGGTGFQVAGRLAELATGKPWAQLFAERVEQPLKLERTGFARTANPRIAGGAQTTAAEWARALGQLLPDPAPDLLGPALRAEMLADQTRGVPLVQSPYALAPGKAGLRAGLGFFRDRVSPDGRALEVVCQGVFGATGWVDLEHRVTGVLLVKGELRDVWPVEEKLRALVRVAVEAR